MEIQFNRMRNTIIIAAIVLLLAATGLLILYFTLSTKPEGYVDGIGVVDHITTDWVGTSVYEHYFIKYTYEDIERINELHNYSGIMRVGDTINILINSKDPTMIQTLGTAQGNFNMLLGCFVVYGMSFIAGTAALVLTFRKKKIPLV